MTTYNIKYYLGMEASDTAATLEIAMATHPTLVDFGIITLTIENPFNRTLEIYTITNKPIFSVEEATDRETKRKNTIYTLMMNNKIYEMFFSALGKKIIYSIVSIPLEENITSRKGGSGGGDTN
jgi:hypothetical protein